MYDSSILLSKRWVFYWVFAMCGGVQIGLKVDSKTYIYSNCPNKSCNVRRQQAEVGPEWEEFKHRLSLNKPTGPRYIYGRLFLLSLLLSYQRTLQITSTTNSSQ